MVARRNFLLALLAATFTCIVVLQMSLDGWVLREAVRYTVSIEKKAQTGKLFKTEALLNHSSDVKSSNQSSSSSDVREPASSYPTSRRSPLIVSSTSGTLFKQELLSETSKSSSPSESSVIGKLTTSSHSSHLPETLSNFSSVARRMGSESVNPTGTLPPQSMSAVPASLPRQNSTSFPPHLPQLPKDLFHSQLSSTSSNISQISESVPEKSSGLLPSALPPEINHENIPVKPFVDNRQLASRNQSQDTETSNNKVEARVKVRSFDNHMRSRGILQRKPPQEFINPQERLEEILKQSNGVQVRSRADPLRSLRSIPTVKPEEVTHVILLTYFRSGSTFVGDLLQQNWRTFYHFEPLHFMTYDSRIGGDKLKEACELFGSILRCNFSNQENYLRWAKRPDNQFLFERNMFLWFACKSSPRMCFTPEMVSAVCQRAPVQVMKITRLNMRDLREFLSQNPDIKTKVVYLVRDPRGIISSRRTLDWCSDNLCSDPHFLCAEMVDDLRVFEELQEKDPDKFIQILYEDIALYPEREAKRLFEFLGLAFSVSVQRFLRTHTTARKTDGLNPYSTRRNSSSMAFSWRSRLTYSQVNQIQATCPEVIHRLNYSFVVSRREFYTLRGIKPPGSGSSLNLKNLSPHSSNEVIHFPETVNTSGMRVVDNEVMVSNVREKESSAFAKQHTFGQSSIEEVKKTGKNSFEKIDPAPHLADSVSAAARLSEISRRRQAQKGVLDTDEGTDDRSVKNR